MSDERPTGGPSLFISYSHEDEEWKDRLLKHLRAANVDSSIAYWDDRQIRLGDAWSDEIDRALVNAQAAVLLISVDFLDSDFIRTVEVPKLLERSASDGVRLLPLLVRECPWDAHAWLKRLQMHPTEARPLNRLRDADEALSTFAKEVVRQLAGPSPVGSGAARPAPRPVTTSSPRESVGSFDGPLDRIVRVVVRDADGESQGTGFRFSSDRVVTAFHVVEDAEEIRILEPDGGGWRDSGALDPDAGCGILWPPEGMDSPPDVAVLGTPEIPDLSPAPLCQVAWTGRPGWESHGYPVDEPTTRRGFYGEAFSSSAGSAVCELTVKDSHVDDVEDWGGLSGAPIFLDSDTGHGLFAGVIGEAPRNARGRRLWATALPALLDDDSFRLALLGSVDEAESDFDFDAFVATYQAKLADELRAFPEVLGDLRSEFPNLRVAEGGLTAEGLADYLCSEAPFRDLATTCAKVCFQLEKAQKAQRAEVVRTTFHLAGPPALTREFGQVLPELRGNRVDLDVATPMMAECLVAALGRRMLRFRKADTINPEAYFCVPEPQHFGLDIDGQERADDVARDLARLARFKTSEGPIRDARLTAATIIGEKDLMPYKVPDVATMTQDEAEAYWRKDVVGVAANRLRELMDDEEGQFYFLRMIDGEGTENDRAFLEALKDSLKELLVATYQKGAEGQIAEEDTLIGSPLRRMHNRKKSKETTT